MIICYLTPCQAPGDSYSTRAQKSMFKVKIPESVAYDHPSWSSSLYSPPQSPYWIAYPRPDPKLSSQRLSKAMEPSVPSITVADIEVR